jgi:hypothetical protein
VERETKRRRRREEAWEERRERKQKNAAKVAGQPENRPRSPLQMLHIQGTQPHTEISTIPPLSKSPQPQSVTDDQRNTASVSPVNSASQSSSPPSQEKPENRNISTPSKPDQSRPQGSTTGSVSSQRPYSPFSFSSAVYDKRMPPPPLDWRLKAGSGSQRAAATRVAEKTVAPQNVNQPQKIQTAPVNNVDDIVKKMVQESQDVNAPPAKGSFITGKRNQLDPRNPAGVGVGTEDLDERKIMNSYIRDGDDRIGILSDGWKEVHEPSHVDESSSSSRKRSHDDVETPSVNSFKKRKLKSEYCPAKHTTWKPAWLDTVQCYPVDQNGEDMSDVECLQGDGIHRNADKLKQILETECMYIPSHRVDQLMIIAQETYDALKRTKEFYTNGHPNAVRIERHEVIHTE